VNKYSSLLKLIEYHYLGMFVPKFPFDYHIESWFRHVPSGAVYGMGNIMFYSRRSKDLGHCSLPLPHFEELSYNVHQFSVVAINICHFPLFSLKQY
jgi:hypothetical protein